jgi:hypothetical protein
MPLRATTKRTWTSLIVGAAAVPLIACGGDPTSTGEPLDVVSRAVVSGATNISDGIITSSLAESETAAVGLGTSYAVAYNTFNDPVPNERCRGYSTIGVSYAAFNGFAYLTHATHLAVPSGMAALLGDPSIAAWDNGSSYSVFVSTLAMSSTQFNNQPPLADGCISRDNFDLLNAAYVCVFTLTMPKSGAGVSGISATSSFCQSSGGVHDGTALTAYNNVPYLATFTGSAIVMSAGGGAFQTVPFGRGMGMHPIWTKNEVLDMFAPDSNGKLWEISYNPSTGTWSTPLAAPSAYSLHAGLPFGIREGKEYAAAYVPGSAGPGATYLFFINNNILVGYSHSSGGIPGWTQVFASNSAYQAFHPAVAVATVPNEYPPYSGFHLGLTYWDTSGGPGGSAGLRYTTDSLTTVTTLASENPCPYGGYWGDYDEMFVRSNNTANPYFYRAFTDSTKSACTTPGSDWSTATPQHISIVRAPGPAR